ncbi:MAG TPA: amidohydrolase family protein [Solirubrobacteraceae bacterium]|nr:amidohydrolase family protein [Solirubrobacteraceae bacterium]
MLDIDGTLRPWFDRLAADVPGLELFDAHTHLGSNDPDGFRQAPEELLEALDSIGARALVFPMHEPSGYPPANDMVLAAAAASGGRLQALCRVDPRDRAVAEAHRCLDAGARGIKLHPRAERFDLSEPAVRDLVALAHERGAPVLIHAGRGIPALGQDTVRLAGEFPEARMILAHCAISDLAWLWNVLPDHPNLFVDTAWWAPADIIALFALAPPGNILWASDSPYGRPLVAATQSLRCAVQAGLSAEQIRGVMGGQVARLLAGEEPADLGPPPGQPARPYDVLLERVVTHLTSTMARAFVRAEYDEPLALARLACAVGEQGPQAEVCSRVLELLDLYEEHLAPPTDGRPIPPAARLIVFALIVARTPDAPLPAGAGAPPPTRDHAEGAEAS